MVNNLCSRVGLESSSLPPCTTNLQKSAVTTASSQQARQVIRELKDAGAKMYGAFWCSHCFEQKQIFGKEVASNFPYVECFPDGWTRVRSRSVGAASWTLTLNLASPDSDLSLRRVVQ